MARRTSVVVLFLISYVIALKQLEQPYKSLFQQDFEISKIVFSESDEDAWRLPTFQVRGREQFEPPSENRVYWWRTWATIDSNLFDTRPLGIGIWSYTASYDLYWDGVYIGSNGQPADPSGPIPGKIDKIFVLSDSLQRPGKHLVAARASHPSDDSPIPYILVRNYDTQSQGLLYVAVFINIFSGIFLILSVYYIITYLKAFRSNELILFSIICFSLFLFVIAHYGKFYYKYDYDLHPLRLRFIEIIIGIIAVSSVYLLNVFFHSRRHWRWLLVALAIQLVLILAPLEHIVKMFYQLSGGFILMLVYNLNAFYLRKEGSYELLFSSGSLATSVFFPGYYFLELQFVISSCVLLGTNIYLLSKKIANQRTQYEKYLLESSRLKAELLSKNIQPHFLMNTLTSLISWVEESPAVAVKFIDALAREFDYIMKFSGRQLVRIQEEIDLCSVHLETMGFRNERSYRLTTAGVNSDHTIPPAIFLTLLENGLTHSAKDADLEFQLIAKDHEGTTTYSFITKGTNAKPEQKEIVEGTGLNYVKARLCEAYKDNWELSYELKEFGWQTTIIIRRK